MELPFRKMRFFSDYSKNSSFRTNMNADIELCHIGCEDLDTAIEFDCLEHFRRFFRGADMLDRRHTTLLHIASNMKSPRVLEYLLEMGEIDVNSVDSYGYTPLHLAVRQSQDGFTASVENIRRCTRLLLNYGADPCVNIFGKKRTPIDLADDDEEVVEMLDTAFGIKDPGFE